MTLKRILHFPTIKIIIGSLVVAGSVALGEWLSKSLLDEIRIPGDFKNLITATIDAFIALFSYILLFRSYERRTITELSLVAFWKNAVIGFLAGFILQSLLILVIYMFDGYSIKSVNPVSFLLPAFTTALTADVSLCFLVFFVANSFSLISNVA